MFKSIVNLLKKIDNYIGKMLSENVSQEFKSRVVENIEKANSEEYRMQVAEHHLINHIIDEILSDPYWYQIAVDACNNNK